MEPYCCLLAVDVNLIYYNREMLKELVAQEVSLGAMSWIIICCVGKIFFNG